MCILCVIQKWSRKVATMLPWLVIPLIGMWMVSQFLPPAFRFEITSPRLACVLVLLVTLFWYEVLMPQLSAWRVRRNARLRERKRFEAIEMQKLRKTATRRCRNCLTAYRDQNPAGGRFMCSYCGHISKRPVLDLPVPPGLGRLSSSGILRDLVEKGGKMLNGKVWSDNNWSCSQDWLENGGKWANIPVGKSSYMRKNNGGFFSSGNFFSERSYSFLVVFVSKTLATILLSIMWPCRKLFRISFAEDDTSMDADIRGLAKKGENGVNSNESRSEKARRKAEEKRQARLEKEQLEEEERKQREEVARLVEERRKLRDTKTETEKVRVKGSPRDNNGKREAERKRQERKKEKDRGSSTSNSDVDDLEKKAGKEIERNRKGEIARRDLYLHRAGTDVGHGSKAVTTNNHNRGRVGTRYLDRMKGNFFSSSRTLTKSGFFGKGTTAHSNTREHRSGAPIDHVHITANKNDSFQSERRSGKSNAHADDQNLNRHVVFDSQPQPAPKRSWQQLFTRSSTVTSSTNTNVISRPNGKPQTEAQSPISSGLAATQQFDNPTTFGLPSALPNFVYGNTTNTTGLQSLFSEVGESPTRFLPKESDPDPASLIGPVYESLDNIQLDLGFLYDVGFENLHSMNHLPSSSEASRPSPIASPVSRLRTPDEMHANSSMEDHGSSNEKEWQMWNSSPIYQDNLGLVGGPPAWCLRPELNGLNKEGVVHLGPQKNDDRTLSNTNCVGEFHNGNGFVHPANDDPWVSRTLYGGPMLSKDGTTHNELVYRSPNGSATNIPFQMSHGNVWVKKEKVGPPVCVEGIGSTSTVTPPVGLYSTPDVQSLWSYE